MVLITVGLIKGRHEIFSSPSGDGLVQSLLYHPKACFSFSSPSGDGLVLHFRVPTVQHHRFSSPSGDGLVPEAPADDDAAEIIFVPAWGLVGSLAEWYNKQFRIIFVPAWGWVGSLEFCANDGSSVIFVPEWGWVGSFRL